MYNLNLLQKNLDVDEYEALGDRVLHAKTYYAGLPTYAIAECPFCHEKNTEKLDTYSLRHWPGVNAWGGKSVWGDNAIVHHCKHFALVQPFVNFNGLEPLEACNEFGPEVPHVIGYLLEDHCEAVIHALPLCRTEEGQFVPRYMLFIVSYFSKKYSPEEIRAKIYRFNSPFWEEPYTQLFSEPPDGREIWWDLPYWISKRKLYWLDTQSLSLELRTGDGENFPYKGIHGRIWTYFESYPLPPKKGEIILPRFDGTKPLICRFKREDIYDEYGAFWGLELSIEWENSEGLALCQNRSHLH